MDKRKIKKMCFDGLKSKNCEKALLGILEEIDSPNKDIDFDAYKPILGKNDELDDKVIEKCFNDVKKGSRLSTYTYLKKNHPERVALLRIGAERLI